MRAFVSCELDEIAIDNENLDWVPKGPLAEFAPPGPGEGPNSLAMRYGTLGIPVSATSDGQLDADTSNLPESGPLSVIAGGIHEWVDAFNKTMNACTVGAIPIDTGWHRLVRIGDTVGLRPQGCFDEPVRL